ncbi:transposase, partial [Glutamicibacter bergerei]
YQKMVDAYRQPKPEVGRWALEQLINEVGTKVPQGLPELKKLGGTLRRRKTDILAYFDHVGSSNGPTEALNGRLEHLRGIALGFKNLAHYIARSLLETGGFRRRLHPQS